MSLYGTIFWKQIKIELKLQIVNIYTIHKLGQQGKDIQAF